jgi:diaminopimelate decarboxylase/SAM-dependent methyltransferase
MSARESRFQETPEALFAATRDVPTPFLAVDPRPIRLALARFRALLPSFRPFYAVKVQPAPIVLRELAALGTGFEIASPAELDAALDAGATADRIVCMHPVKSERFLHRLAAAGVGRLAADSVEELEKIAANFPAARVAVRLDVPGRGSVWKSNEKFGLPAGELPRVVERARALGVALDGLTMHVGSQATSLDNWAEAFRQLRAGKEVIEANDSRVRFISIGGGFPVAYRHPVPALEEIGRLAERALGDLAPGVALAAEPGRALVAAAGTLVASVVGTATRRGESWAYLDAGVYQGLMEPYQCGEPDVYPVVAEPTGRPARRYTLAGPTCDSLDVLNRGAELPELRPGDRVAFRQAGAYSTALGTEFNSFPPPAVVAAPVPATVASRARIGFPADREDWATAAATTAAERLTILGHPVMERWEEPYMALLADIATRNGGRVLEVGFGMGIAAGFVRARRPAEHVIIECNRDVFRAAEEFARAAGGSSAPVKTTPRLGFWEDVTPGLPAGSFDGILFDTYPLQLDQVHRNHYPFFAEAFRLLRPGGVFTYYSDEARRFSPDHLQALHAAGFSDISGVVCPVSPPATCEYWQERSLLAPVVRR